MTWFCRGVSSLALLSLCASSALVLAQSPSFDCTKASTAVERAICASPRLSALDSEMGTLWSDIWRAPTDDSNSALRKTLVEQQREWMTKRNAYEDTESVARLFGFLEEHYQRRISELRALQQGTGAVQSADVIPQGVMAAQRDGSGSAAPSEFAEAAAGGTSSPDTPSSLTTTSTAELLSSEGAGQQATSTAAGAVSAPAGSSQQTPSEDEQATQANPDSSSVSGGITGALTTAIGYGVIAALFIMLCALIYGASAGVAFCHDHGYTVYRRRRELILWGVPAVFLCGGAAYLISLMAPTTWQETVSALVFLVAVLGWWVLQYRAAKASNPHAEPQHVWKIYLARVGSATVMGGMVWALLPQGGSSSNRTLQQEINRVMFLLAIAAMGWMYANYVCYPDAEKYPNAQGAEV